MHFHHVENRSVHIFVVIDEVGVPVVVDERGIVALRDVGEVPPAPGVTRHDAQSDRAFRVVFINGFVGLVPGCVHIFAVDRFAAEHAHIVSAVGRVSAVRKEEIVIILDLDDIRSLAGRMMPACDVNAEIFVGIDGERPVR